MNRYAIGYTQGVYDMFHIGHLNVINNAKKYCDYLIVGINSNQLVEDYKHKTPVIDEKEREQIVANLKSVDECIIVNTLDKEEICKKYNINAVFIGDDWKGSDRWNKTEKTLKKIGVDVVYLPYTDNISSTGLKSKKGTEVQE